MVAVRLTLEQPVHIIALLETAFIALVSVAVWNVYRTVYRQWFCLYPCPAPTSK